MATDATALRPINDFYDHDRNEIQNDLIMDKYIPLIYENVRKRYGNKLI
jgi:hypothetical protein